MLRHRPADLFFSEAKRRDVGVIVRVLPRGVDGGGGSGRSSLLTTTVTSIAMVKTMSARLRRPIRCCGA